MLTDLRIQDVVIIDKLNLSFDNGFITFTGETGAGKSIILDALGLALGQRSEARMVRAGSDQASVTASFDIQDPKIQKELKSQFAEQDLDFDDTLILRRTLTADGKSKAFINDQPVGVNFLKTIGESLVEIHGQFETQKLLDPKTHLRVLDDFSGLSGEVSRLRGIYQTWRQAVKERDELEALLEQAARDQDYWQNAVKELSDLAPQENEEEHLVAQRSLMMHAEKVLQNLSEAEVAMTDDKTGARARIHTALRNLERAQDKIPEDVEGMLSALNRALIDVDETIDAIEALAEKLQFNRNSQAETDERLFALRGAARKYQTTVVELPKKLEEFEEKLSLIADQSDAKKRLDKKVADTKKDYHDKAAKLSAKRQSAATKLAKAVMAELGPLKLEKATFAVEVTAKSEENWTADGMDQVTFLISTNPGTAPGPLNKIASGGEMARFMLALKVVTQEADATPTLIFDEVDTGVGGAVAEAIGLRLKKLGEAGQVFAVTHSPQVAAKGHAHLRISKTADKKSTRTTTEILDHEARVEEIARMLSGAAITPEARAAALNLMDAPKSRKRA